MFSDETVHWIQAPLLVERALFSLIYSSNFLFTSNESPFMRTSFEILHTSDEINSLNSTGLGYLLFSFFHCKSTSSRLPPNNSWSKGVHWNFLLQNGFCCSVEGKPYHIASDEFQPLQFQFRSYILTLVINILELVVSFEIKWHFLIALHFKHLIRHNKMAQYNLSD